MTSHRFRVIDGGRRPFLIDDEALDFPRLDVAPLEPKAARQEILAHLNRASLAIFRGELKRANAILADASRAITEASKRKP